MTTFRDHLKENLKDAEFKNEYESLAVEFEIKQQIIDARKKQNLTQKQLSAITGINQSDISKLENGNLNPSVAYLQKIANALGKKLHVEFR